MIKPFRARLPAALIMTIAALSCSRLEEAKNSAIGKAAEHAIKAADGGLSRKGDVELGLTVSGKSSAPGVKELAGKGLLPPGAEIQSYIKGITEDTANIVSTLTLAELELFYSGGLEGGGYKNEHTIKADGMLSARWISVDNKRLVSVYAFETPSGTKGSVIFSSQE